MKRVLQVFRDGRRFEPLMQGELLDGYQGNVQALQIMAKMVRDDRTQLDLRNFVSRHVLRSEDVDNAEIERIFEFCQKEIVYRQDPVKVERIADLWSCLYALNPRNPEGDCGIKSVAMATMLALFGHKPCFAIIKQNPYSTNFNHVFVEIEIDGKFRSLDATANEPMFFEPKGLVKERFFIF